MNKLSASYHGDRGTYSSVIPTRKTRSALLEICNTVSEGVVTDQWDLHATVVWSQDAMSEGQRETFAQLYSVGTRFVAKPKEFVVWSGHDKVNYLVLLLDSKDLVHANTTLSTFGLKSDFAYQPHMTIAEEVSSDYPVSALNEMLKGRLEIIELTGLRLEDARKSSASTTTDSAPPLTTAKTRVQINSVKIPSASVELLADVHELAAATADVPESSITSLAERADPARLTDEFLDVPVGYAPGKDSTCIGAGVLFCARDTGRLLFVKRSADSDFPGTWCCLGGGVEAGETIEQGVRREVTEEGGYTEPYDLIPMFKNHTPEYTYHNHFAFVPTEFEPVLNDEHTAFVWADVTPHPCHPGLLKAIKAYQDENPSNLLTEAT